jgi:electron transport complex protein RnfD
MPLATSATPPLSSTESVGGLMLKVLYALVPGTFLMVWFFGVGVLFNVTIAVLSAGAAEAFVLALRKKSFLLLLDCSAVLTAVLLAVSLPPLTPWWLPLTGALFAIVIAKQLYGGLGYNPFNPAMAAYAALLISFPRSMTAWPLPSGFAAIDLSDSLDVVFGSLKPELFDGRTGATPLDMLKTQLRLGKTVAEARASPLFSVQAVRAWQCVSIGYLLGGLWLVSRKKIDWRIPVSFLGGLSASALVFYLMNPSRYASPFFHLFAGGSMLGAFFIATDPVTAATTPVGRWVYGAAAGLLVFIIRAFGGFPDGVAFAVLLMNLAAPTIDHYTRPRIYGEQR